MQLYQNNDKSTNWSKDLFRPLIFCHWPLKQQQKGAVHVDQLDTWPNYFFVEMFLL